MDIITNHITYYISIVVLAFILVLVGIPSIINTAIKFQLFDQTDSYRKIHGKNISRLGGVAIFSSFTITILLFATTVNYQEANFLITSCIFLVGLGLKDDLYGVSAITKLILQLVVAIILVVLGNFRLTSWYGVFNLWEVNVFWGSLFSIAVIIFVNNAFNLIDGIDGLAGTLGAISTLSFGVFFALADELPYAFIAFAMFGSIAGFLIYNYAPARIFMGDTGSLIIGLVCVILAIKFIELNKISATTNPYFLSAPAIAVSVLIVPIFDSIRVFVIRILHGNHPFKGDRNHVHHRLQQLGFGTTNVVIILSIFSIAMIILSILIQKLGNFTMISIIMSICVAFNALITYKVGKNLNPNYKLSDILLIDTVKTNSFK